VGAVASTRCTAQSVRSGERCRRWAIEGAEVCPTHGGRTPQVKAAAARRRAEAQVERELGALADFRADGGTVDPIGALQRLLNRSERRVEFYSELLQRQYDIAERNQTDADLPPGIKALIGHKMAVAGIEGRLVPVEEAIRALVELEAAERDRCAKYAKLALDAKLDERLTTAHETQVNMVADALGAALAEMGLSHGQQQEAAGRVARILRSVPSGQA
jgi:hypothetical protein